VQREKRGRVKKVEEEKKGAREGGEQKRGGRKKLTGFLIFLDFQASQLLL
jgi:hypothetical protein